MPVITNILTSSRESRSIIDPAPVSDAMKQLLTDMKQLLTVHVVMYCILVSGSDWSSTCSNDRLTNGL